MVKTSSSGVHEEQHWDYWDEDSYLQVSGHCDPQLLEEKVVDGEKLSGVWRKAASFVPAEGARRFVFRVGSQVQRNTIADTSNDALSSEQLADSFVMAQTDMFGSALHAGKRLPCDDAADPYGEMNEDDEVPHPAAGMRVY